MASRGRKKILDVAARDGSERVPTNALVDFVFVLPVVFERRLDDDRRPGKLGPDPLGERQPRLPAGGGPLEPAILYVAVQCLAGAVHAVGHRVADDVHPISEDQRDDGSEEASLLLAPANEHQIDRDVLAERLVEPLPVRLHQRFERYRLSGSFAAPPLLLRSAEQFLDARRHILLFHSPEMMVDQVVQGRLIMGLFGPLDLRVDFPELWLLKSEGAEPLLNLPEEIDLVLQRHARSDLRLWPVAVPERHSDEKVGRAPARSDQRRQILDEGFSGLAARFVDDGI
jgi:hypothetical protein